MSKSMTHITLVAHGFCVGLWLCAAYNWFVMTPFSWAGWRSGLMASLAFGLAFSIGLQAVKRYWNE